MVIQNSEVFCMIKNISKDYSGGPTQASWKNSVRHNLSLHKSSFSFFSILSKSSIFFFDKLRLKLTESDLFEYQIKTNPQASGLLWMRIWDFKVSHLEISSKIITHSLLESTIPICHLIMTRTSSIKLHNDSL